MIFYSLLASGFKYINFFSFVGDLLNKAVINYFIDVLLLISGAIVGITGLIKMPFMDFLQTHKVVHYPMLSFVHDWSGVIFVFLIIIHLLLHIPWIVCMTKAIFCKGGKKCER